MQPQMSGPQTIPLQRPQGPLPRIGEIQVDDQVPMGQQSNRRVSFGSVFDASSRQNGGGHNNEENLNEWGETQDERSAPIQPNTALFKLEIKPKDPPMFYGRAAEDVSTWISKVSDFFYLTGATDRQQVAYTATLLQEAAADWWVTLLRENYGERPADFQEFAVRLEKRFGSSTRVDQARVALRDIRQGHAENVRAYSTRFEGLLGKLPSWDQDWAKTQFIWGLHSRVAELVMILSPADLAQAIWNAEEVEMARNLSSGGQTTQKNTNPMRGRGRFQRGRGRFNAIQGSSGTNVQQQAPQVQAQQMATQNVQYTSGGGKQNAQCYNCSGYGHFYWECPSPPQSSQRGGIQSRGRWNTRGRRGGRRGGPLQPVGATLITSGSDAAGQEIQAQPGAPTVPCPNPSGSGRGN